MLWLQKPCKYGFSNSDWDQQIWKQIFLHPDFIVYVFKKNIILIGPHYQNWLAKCNEQKTAYTKCYMTPSVHQNSTKQLFESLASNTSTNSSGTKVIAFGCYSKHFMLFFWEINLTSIIANDYLILNSNTKRCRNTDTVNKSITSSI